MYVSCACVVKEISSHNEDCCVQEAIYYIKNVTKTHIINLLYISSFFTKQSYCVNHQLNLDS